MEIIKQGNIKPRKYKGVCPICGCEFVFGDDSVYQPYRLICIKYVDCPTCGNPIKMISKQITQL